MQPQREKSSYKGGAVMELNELRQKTDNASKKMITVSVLLAALFPEYIAPFFTLIGFLVFKKRYSLTEQKVKIGTVGKVFLIFLCFSFISAIWSLTPIYSAAVSLLWMGMLLGSFMISNLTVNRQDLNKLIYAFSLSGGIVGGINLLQYLLLLVGVPVPNPIWHIFDKLIYHIVPFNITDTANVWETSRAASTFDNPLICATFLVIAFPIAFYGFISGEKKNMTVCGISSLLIIGGIAGTTSRGAALAVVSSLLVLVFLNSRKILSVLVTLFSSVGLFAAVIIKRNDILAADLDKSTDSRLKMWEACLKLIAKKPLFGYGAGCQSTSIGMAEYGVNKPHAHSLYFEFATELGIVGLIFLLVVFCFIFADIIKLIRTGGTWKRLGIAYLAVFVGLLVASCTEFTLQTPKELQYFMFYIGLLEASKRISMCEQAKITEDSMPEYAVS